LVLQVVHETVLLHAAQFEMQALQVDPERKYPFTQLVQAEYAVQVEQSNGQAEQVCVAEIKK